MSRSNQIPLMGNCCSAEDNTSVLPPDPKTSTFKKGTRVHWTGLGELRAHPTTQNTALAPRPAAEATTTIAVLDGSNDGIGAAPVESGSRVLVTVLSKRTKETITPSDVEGDGNFGSRYYYWIELDGGPKKKVGEGELSSVLR
ncbi:hypothetical protein MFRU_032g00430 [Monilinia fructicola]|nr:hypothetical protein MFRU_032g00430 [Monilinia fructicola]